jgi:hypothetical protein
VVVPGNNTNFCISKLKNEKSCARCSSRNEHEILLDKSGKIEGVVIGVGGFLGMGEHDIKVDMSKLKFVDEPVRTSATTSTTTTTTGEANRPATTTTTRSTEKQWYPNHAVLSGASKEQLKSMPQFKYN